MAMLKFDRKQMTTIGQARLRPLLARFLHSNLPEARKLPRAELVAAVEQALARCRELGLDRQGAIAAYTLACCKFGTTTVEADPVLRPILQDRRIPQRDKALLLRIWITHAANTIPAPTVR